MRAEVALKLTFRRPVLVHTRTIFLSNTARQKSVCNIRPMLYSGSAAVFRSQGMRVPHQTPKKNIFMIYSTDPVGFLIKVIAFCTLMTDLQ